MSATRPGRPGTPRLLRPPTGWAAAAGPATHRVLLVAQGQVLQRRQAGHGRRLELLLLLLLLVAIGERAAEGQHRNGRRRRWRLRAEVKRGEETGRRARLRKREGGCVLRRLYKRFEPGAKTDQSWQRTRPVLPSHWLNRTRRTLAKTPEASEKKKKKKKKTLSRALIGGGLRAYAGTAAKRKISHTHTPRPHWSAKGARAISSGPTNEREGGVSVRSASFSWPNGPSQGWSLPRCCKIAAMVS